MHGKLRCNQTGLILCVFLGLSTIYSEYPLKWSIIAKSEGADTFNSVELQPQKQKKTKKKETRKREQTTARRMSWQSVPQYPQYQGLLYSKL